MESEEYISLYIDTVQDNFMNLSGSGFRLLFLMMRDAEYPNKLSKRIADTSGNVIYITPDMKSAWATELRLEVSSVNNLVTHLLKKEMVLPLKANMYLMNPEIFFKGTWAQRNTAVEELKNKA